MKKSNTGKLVKPIRPVEPDVTDRVKYPRPESKQGTNSYGQAIYLANHDFISDYHKYQKALVKYEKDLEKYYQLKHIHMIKAAKEDYILKKYKIIKL